MQGYVSKNNRVSYVRERQILDFVEVGKANGLRDFRVALPSCHPIFAPAGRPGQIRAYCGTLAEAVDELGNRVTLSEDGIVRQWDAPVRRG